MKFKLYRVLKKSCYWSHHVKSRWKPLVYQHDLILTLLLGSLAILGVTALFASVLGHILEPSHHPSSNGLITSLCFSIATFVLWLLAKRGWYWIGTISLLLLIWMAALGVGLLWSYELPNTALLISLAIIIGGILLGDRQSWLFSGLVMISYILLGWAQISGLLHPNFDWNDALLEGGDLFGLVIIIFLIALVSWLSNHEIMRALARAKASELELAAERDGLEGKVVERTSQLEQAQLEKVMQLQRFAEFGKLTSGLLHDLANPITSASLSLQLLEKEERSELVVQAHQSLESIEQYIEAARNQLRLESRNTSFDVESAIKQTLAMIGHRAKAASVEIKMKTTSVRLYGDIVKFQQLIANLMTNAIDAYADTDIQTRTVLISASPTSNGVIITVIDHGKGISDKTVGRIFEPFYSTKNHTNGTGLGLMLARQTANQDFGGSLSVQSETGKGTIFTARLYNTDRPEV